MTTTLTVFQVIRIQLNGPFGEQVLEIAEYDDRRLAETVSRAWAQMDEVKAGRQRVKLLTR